MPPKECTHYNLPLRVGNTINNSTKSLPPTPSCHIKHSSCQSILWLGQRLRSHVPTWHPSHVNSIHTVREAQWKSSYSTILSLLYGITSPGSNPNPSRRSILHRTPPKRSKFFLALNTAGEAPTVEILLKEAKKNCTNLSSKMPNSRSWPKKAKRQTKQN